MARNTSVAPGVRAGLRVLDEREAGLEALRAALIAGEASGDPEPFDFAAFIAKKK
jgi:antitoxin ParD1/3/4